MWQNNENHNELEKNYNSIQNIVIYMKKQAKNSVLINIFL